MNCVKTIAPAIGVCLFFTGMSLGETQNSHAVRADKTATLVPRPAESDPSGAGPSVAAGAQAVVPRLMKFTGVLHDAAGKPLTGTVDVTFSLYSSEAGGDALWFETQSVPTNELGQYTALLGAMHADGLPVDLFTSGEVRWLGIQVGSQPEQQPRVLLVSVPYALKAGDAETLGGKPASAYMLSNTQNGTAATNSVVLAPTGATPTSTSGTNQQTRTANTSAPLTACGSVTSDGTVAVNTIPLFSTACNIEGSNIYQFNGNVGVGITNPSAGFYVSTLAKHDGDARFNMVLEDSTSAAAGTGGGMDFTGYFIGTTSKAGFASIRGVKENATQGNYASALIFDTRVNGGNQSERMRITSTGNLGIGTSAPAALLEVNGSAKFDGAVTFAAGQTVTGNITASGTISGNGSGLTALTGANVTGTVASASSANGVACASCVGNTQLGINYAASTTQGGDATGALALGGILASNYARLDIGNSMLGNQSVTGNLNVISSASGATALSVQATNAATGNTAINGVADGLGGTGLFGEAENGSAAAGVWGMSSSGLAGLFTGDIHVSGIITAGTKDFKIDDPIDPANKFLYHASVESSQMKTIYDGIASLDAKGEATVQLPEWFEALNGDYRYQLTCVGGYAQVYIAQKIQGNKFRIAGGTPGLEVDWQVTGVRHDAFAQAHPLNVEVEKPAHERGYYLHPQLYGAPKEKAIEWADHPQQMSGRK